MTVIGKQKRYNIEIPLEPRTKHKAMLLKFKSVKAVCQTLKYTAV